MTGRIDENPVLALGKLHGLLAALAWANHKCNHSYSFTVEELPPRCTVLESLAQYFGERASKVLVTQLADWHTTVEEASYRWLFQFRDLVKPKAVCALTDEQEQQEMVGTVLGALMAGLQPLEVWRVEIEPRGFYECAWDDFAVRGARGLFLLHLGVSD